MGGPFRAIVGGADQNMSFPPAQAIQLDNYSDQYGHLILSDVFVAPGQIGMVVLVDGVRADRFKFEAPPGATVAAPTAGQICLIRTYDVAEVGAPTPPLQPGVGVLLPIGVDQPPHHHPHTHGAHLHAHSATHVHSSATHLHGHSATHVHSSATHLHAHSATHVHAISAANVSNTGSSDGTVGFHTHTYLDVTGTNTNATAPGNTDNATPGNTGATAPGNTDNATPGNTGATAPGNTDNATPASDSTNPDLHHTHP